MICTRLLIVGAGGHGISVAEAALLSGRYRLVGFIDDSRHPGTAVLGIPILGNIADLKIHLCHADKVIVAIGNNSVRETLMGQLADEKVIFATIVHPTAIISPRASILHGCTIMAGAVIGTEAKLGVGVIVNCAAVVDHHAQVLDYGHLGVNACMAGGSILGKGAWIQAGCSIGYGVRIDDGIVLPPGTSRCS